MLSREMVLNRAIAMGIETGEMPEVKFIWSVQESERMKPCFGREEQCDDTGCRWRVHCRALQMFGSTRMTRTV